MALADGVTNGSKDALHLTILKKKKNAKQSAPVNDDSKTPEEQQQDSPGSQDDPVTHSQQDGPQGGFDSTLIPSPPQGTTGYTLRFRIIRALGLSMGDAHVFSSDPYVLAQLNTGLPRRHKEEPNLRFRTQTVRKDTEPEWDEDWIVANVPSTGFKLKLRIYDEDPADQDDLLGNVHVNVSHIDDDWDGIRKEPYKLRLRESSKRALLIRTFATALRFVEHVHGELYLTIENLGRTGEDGQNGRAYTLGPPRWVRHYSPLLGRLANTREPEGDEQIGECAVTGQKSVERYNFQANQMQLPGPVPPKLYHRFVEFKPWVKRMFTTKGFQGVVLGKALHHQHRRVYNFDRSTVWGYFPEGAGVEMTKKFLDLVHYDMGGRIFTYVFTLDALFRFTETGKEFGIDMLSKHTMHSDVSIYIAFSGEFFIRRLKHRRRPPPPNPTEGNSQQEGPENHNNETHPPHDFDGGPPEADPPKDLSHYELIIDNDSGTYRPNGAMLPLLADYLSHCLPGLHIQTLDCQADADRMSKMKSEQRERKKKEGDYVVYAQVSDSSSISSSDDERLDEVQAAYQDHQAPMRQAPAGHHLDHRFPKGREALETVAKDVKIEQEARVEKMTRNVQRRGKDEGGLVAMQGPRILASREGSFERQPA